MDAKNILLSMLEYNYVVNHGTHHRGELSRYLEDCGYPVAEQELDVGSFVERADD